MFAAVKPTQSLIGVRDDFRLAAIEFTSPRTNGEGDPAIIVTFANPAGQSLRKTFFKPDGGRLVGQPIKFDRNLALPAGDGFTKIELKKDTLYDRRTAQAQSEYNLMEAITPFLIAYQLEDVSGETYESFARNLVARVNEMDDTSKDRKILLKVNYSNKGYAQIAQYGPYIASIEGADEDAIAFHKNNLKLSAKDSTRPEVKPSETTNSPSGTEGLPFAD